MDVGGLCWIQKTLRKLSRLPSPPEGVHTGGGGLFSYELISQISESVDLGFVDIPFPPIANQAFILCNASYISVVLGNLTWTVQDELSMQDEL